MKKILVRADDLGYSEAINYGIAKTVTEGFIKSVGVMTNMPAVEQGLKLLEKETVCFGQHTNICVGKPLTDIERIPSITQPNGEFKSSKEYRNAKEDFVKLDEVILEIEAQYNRFVELTGRQPQYFEGHAVASSNFFKGLEIVAHKYGLKYCAMSLDGGPVRVGNTDLYVHMQSMKPEYEPFEELKKMVLNAHEGACDMFVCHPGYLDAYILKTSSLTVPRVLEVEMVINRETRKWLEEQKAQLVTYDDL